MKTVTAIGHRLFTAAQCRQLDDFAINRLKQTDLMARAGQAAFACLQKLFSHAKRIIILCGSGNNGGDGYVLARLARQAGLDVSLFAISPPAKLKGDARVAAEKCVAAGLTIQPISAEFKLPKGDVIVDSLLGTGLTANVKPEIADVIKQINSANMPVLAMDMPSGLNADTGKVMGIAVHADVTVTFIALKRGLFSGDGPDYRGKIEFDRLGLPDSLYDNVKHEAVMLTLDALKNALLPRPRTAYKNQFGQVLVIGGDRGMPGAPCLAAQAALRAGAGLVTVATHPEHIHETVLQQLELMCYGIKTAKDLAPLIKKADVIVVGPGTGNSKWSQTLIATALDSAKPLIVDAGALGYLAKQTVKPRDRWILTPHPGEAARLNHCATADVEQDRFAAVMDIQRQYGGIIVLKGAGTLVAGESHFVGVCPYGNPGMASGGMGDLLSGIIAGLVAQGIALLTAAELGVCLHARAGDVAADNGERGLLASDLLPVLRQLVN